MEIELKERKQRFEIKTVAETSGLYFLYSKKGELLYIGQSTNVRARLYSHFSGMSHLKHIKDMICYFSVLYAKKEELTALERDFIFNNQPKYNKDFIKPTGVHKGIYFDKDIAHFLDNVQHGNKSEIVNKVMRQFLTENDLL
jgi:predicted GIY-YIG superfamily endonuclease